MIQLYTKKELMQALLFMLTSLRIFLLFTDWEILLEFIEPTWEFIKIRDNSMSTCSIKAHMPCSQQIRLHLLDKQSLMMHHTHSQERDQLLKSKMLQFLEHLENGPIIYFPHKMLEVIKSLNWKKQQSKVVTLMSLLRYFKSSNSMNTLMNLNLETNQEKLSILLHLNWSSHM